ncbi:MAG: DUF5996 family protein, partial [Thermoanaerobaculia bacterium]
WQDTYATLHMWTQIVGKVRLALAPPINHWWQVTSYVTPRGLTTSAIPYGTRTFAIDFDFLDHVLRITTSDGGIRTVPLRPRTVADFYAAVMDALHSLGLEIPIWSMPVEIEGPIPFDRDVTHAAYDPDAAQRFWRVLVQTDRVLNVFRSRFLGKVSPVHFFWGAFDLAVTRFSGRRAPKHGPTPNIADWVVQEAYSHEVSSLGFWPGGGPVTEPVFYAYAYPEPEGFKEAKVEPAAAFYSPDLGEFLLPYEVVRTAASPDDILLRFAQSTYEAAAEAAGWDRAALERSAAT